MRNLFWMDKEKLTRAGFEPATSGLTCRCSTNWANEPYIGGIPILSISLFGGGGASQKSWNHILPFSQGSRPSYDTTWEEGVRGCLIKGYDFFPMNIMRKEWKAFTYFTENTRPKPLDAKQNPSGDVLKTCISPQCFVLQRFRHLLSDDSVVYIARVMVNINLLPDNSLTG